MRASRSLLLILLGWGVYAAPVQAQHGNSTGGSAPGTVMGTPRRPANPPEWIFFPGDPPPLGAILADSSNVRRRWAPDVLRVFLTEPFFSPLATRLVHLPGEYERRPLFTTEETVRMDAFFALRAGLIDEIHREAERVRAMPAHERLQAFEALAAAQAPRAAQLEQTAEWLRERLARVDSWSETRTWRLNRWPLRLPREKVFLLEFQVVRAAAYYQAGFSPAQRRLLRELSIEMSETIASGGRPARASALFFFSPDTARIMRPLAAPPELDQLIDRYIAEKRRLKDELREAIYEAEGMMLELSCRRRLERLAFEQAAALQDVETLAERIRRELVRLPEYRRYRGASPLSGNLESRLAAYVEEAMRLENERAAFIRQRVDHRMAVEVGAHQRDAPELEAMRAGAVFDVRSGERLMGHDQAAADLVAALRQELPAEDALWLQGPATDALRRFVERRAEAEAYVDYDLAALEPGLSPVQRRILFASAVARLRFVLLPPEVQPTKLDGI